MSLPRIVFGAVLLALVVTAGGAEPKAKDPKAKPTNRLAREISPYLLMHAHNPVDWFPWGAEAFAKAKKEKKLVFLSIGYSSCYWCHVMERESFDNKEVARILNKDFVCIKVDREERPDIDSIYMTALNVLKQQGGWPLSMFLTADGKPIVGFTYRFPDDREIEGKTMMGFKSILKFMTKWKTEKLKELTDQADELAKQTSAAVARASLGRSLVDLDRKLIVAATESLAEDFDSAHGGFGSAERKFRGSKFPTPPYLDFLAHEAARAKSTEAAKMLTLTLDNMAQGGIYDQVGGGFHRYSTERTWTVPHFEKMLYDNAQLAEVYARAYALTKKPSYRRIVRETLAFIGREMTSPEGGFYSAIDAETGGEEGRFYVWTDTELADVLKNKEDLALVRRVFGTGGTYNFEEKYHILRLARSLAEIAREMKLTEEQLVAKLAPIRQKLLEARNRRARPFLDKKILTAWNGEMIAGYAVAGKVLGEPAYIKAARKAADFVLAKLRNADGRLLRTYAAQPNKAPEARLNGYLDDYAFLTHGLLALHDATGEKKWLDEAKALTETMLRFHSDRAHTGFFHRTRTLGGLYYTSNDHEKLFARSKDQYDGAQPSGNSMAVRNLVKLWIKTGGERYKQLADLHLRAFAGTMKAYPTSITAMLKGLAIYLDAVEARNKS